MLRRRNFLLFLLIFFKKASCFLFFLHIKYVRKNHYQLIIALENKLCKLHNGISQELENRIDTKSFPRIRGDESGQRVTR